MKLNGSALIFLVAIFFFLHVNVQGFQPSVRRSNLLRSRQGLEESRSSGARYASRAWCDQDTQIPKLVLFDLDGCLWRPEMYELLYFSRGKGAPFTPSEHDKNVLLTVAGEPVQLLKNVREVLFELHSDPKWENTKVGISSRTDAPDWARELLSKFQLPDGTALEEVFQGPIEIRGDSKVKHFRRIAAATGVSFEDMVFFDNEFGNCESVADLGVTVGYCPGGVSTKIWEQTLQAFPAPRGKILE